MSVSYERIKRAIDMWDPVELLVTHAPPDEYDCESREIFEAGKGNNSLCINDLARLILDVFTRNFGSDVFNKKLEECREIAKIILDIVK